MQLYWQAVALLLPLLWFCSSCMLVEPLHNYQRSACTSQNLCMASLLTCRGSATSSLTFVLVKTQEENMVTSQKSFTDDDRKQMSCLKYKDTERDRQCVMSIGTTGGIGHFCWSLSRRSQNCVSVV